MMTREQYLLMKLAEEASEIAQIALKTAQFGMDSVGPCQTKSNRDLLQGEINDLTAVVEMLGGFQYDINAIDAKKLKVDTFCLVSQNLGKVNCGN